MRRGLGVDGGFFCFSCYRINFIRLIRFIRLMMTCGFPVIGGGFCLYREHVLCAIGKQKK